MPWQNEYREGLVESWDGERVVRIPKDFVLVGARITICQQRDGTIAIYPATEEGRQALDKFNPFGDWTEEDWRRLEEYDWSGPPLSGRQIGGLEAGTEARMQGETIMTSDQMPRIVSDPAIMVGKPIIKGTRITVEHILRRLAAGWTFDDIVDQHPRLTKEDVQAAIEFAADQLDRPADETVHAAE